MDDLEIEEFLFDEDEMDCQRCGTFLIEGEDFLCDTCTDIVELESELKLDG
jgi:hypothetical protein